jgi:protein-tyrosine phosphatase
LKDSAQYSPSQKVLVHCAMGISRSSAIVIAWLMKRNNWTLEQAKSAVKSQRSIIKPNEGFVNQLVEFEKELLNRLK